MEGMREGVAIVWMDGRRGVWPCASPESIDDAEEDHAKAIDRWVRCRVDVAHLLC